MPHIKISKRTIDGIIPPPAGANNKATQEFYRDTELTGFGLKVTNKGTKTYIVEARVQGKAKRITLGKHGPLTPEQARKQAQITLGQIATGNDPVADKKDQLIKGVSLAEVYRDYKIAKPNLKPNTLDEYTLRIEGALSDWLNKPMVDITKNMVEARHRHIGQTSQAGANGTIRVLKALFNFAIEQYEDQKGQPVIHINPTKRLSKTGSLYEVRPRQSLLTPTQLKPWFDATLKLNQETTRDYLHFLLFTGLRKSEASNMTWGNVDFNERTFLIPDTKNKDPHRLPMPDYLEDLLKRRHFQSESPWVFPSPIPEGPLKEPRTAVKRVVELSGIKFMVHDLRRTFATTAEKLDIPAYALKRLLNHKGENDVTASYIVPNVERLRAPMQLIADHFKEQIGI
jgi:integrase